MDLSYLSGSSILVTGGTGSFGQRFVTTLLEQTDAGRIIIYSRDELKQSQMISNLRAHSDRLRFFIGDVRDLNRTRRAFSGVDYVVHAAALKQVPALEYNPFEAVKTNILGTQNVIEAAIDAGVKKVLFISTDKAANPANLYGATKLCAEKLIVSGNFLSGEGGTRFSVVRYGNVFGSRGSLVKVIEEQRASGKITLTHEEMTRFWITLGQGIELVLHSLQRMHGGEIFVPKIPSMRVKDFILALAPNCELDVVGIRPGEKLHEVLVTPEEARHTREFDDVYVILPEHEWSDEYPHYDHGAAVEGAFLFASHTNDQWLDDQGLKELLD
jgi:UDP-N-acetylglucosamine 4,6-dehydratase/5-epimerase